jgi:hypothetical protein
MRRSSLVIGGKHRTGLKEGQMPDIGSSPPIVPFGADQTIYLIVDCVGAGSACREIEVERPDCDTVTTELLAGQFSAPVRVIAFNTLEHWSRDISKEIAEEIRVRCDIEGISLPEHIYDFVERHTAPAPQLAL